jgi:hypothetical protein
MSRRLALSTGGLQRGVIVLGRPHQMHSLADHVEPERQENGPRLSGVEVPDANPSCDAENALRRKRLPFVHKDPLLAL